MDATTKLNGAAFLREVVEVFPYQIHTVLTDNGMAFANLPKNCGRYPEIEAFFGGHIFDRVCDQHGIIHKLTKPDHPPPQAPACGPCRRRIDGLLAINGRIAKPSG